MRDAAAAAATSEPERDRWFMTLVEAATFMHIMAFIATADIAALLFAISVLVHGR